MLLVNVSVMLAVVQWASSAGGSPRLPTRTTPPLICAWAAVVRAASPNRTAMLAVRSHRSKPDRAIPPPPSREYVRTGAVTLPRCGGLVNAASSRCLNGRQEEMEGKTAPRREGVRPLRRGGWNSACGYGTVIVVPSPLAVTEKVPVLLDV